MTLPALYPLFMDIERVLSDGLTIYLIWRQNQILALQGPLMPASNWRDRLSRVRRYWPLAVMSMLAVTIWLAPLYPHPLSGLSSPIPVVEKVVQKWGARFPGDDNCNVSLRGSEIITFASKYRVALVCGIDDPTVDKFDDRNIIVSRLYVINPDVMFISVAQSDQMKKVIQKQLSDAAQNYPRGTQVVVAVGKWFEVALLPKSTNTTDIHRLSDVARYGGIILPTVTQQ
jgi:hypothetical protein